MSNAFAELAAKIAALAKRDGISSKEATARVVVKAEKKK